MWSYRLLRQLSEINTHPNITRPQLIRSSQVLSLESVGSTIIARKSFLSDLSFPTRSLILRINPSPGQRALYRQIGKRFFMGDRIQNSTKIRGRV